MATKATSRTLIAATGLGAIALLVLAAVVIARPPDPHTVVVLSPSDALAAVEDLTGNTETDASVSGPFAGYIQEYYKVSGDGVEADVDAHDGTVRALSIEGAFPSDAKVELSSEQAVVLAVAYLADHKLAKPTTDAHASMIDHGVFAEYKVEWQSTVNSALVPDYRAISLNPSTGDVFAYMNFGREYSYPPDARIDRAAAAADAASIVDGGKDLSVADATLQVSFGSQGDQILVWMVTLIGGQSSYEVQVDAITGVAQIVARG